VAIASALGHPAVILLADGTAFADALSVGAAAAEVGGAVLLTDGRVQASATSAYLAAFPPTVVDAVGGPAAAADPDATPLVGSDRYATSALVATQFFVHPLTIGLASGANYPDALAGAASAAVEGVPLFLTDPDALPAATLAYLRSIAATLTTIDVYGGPAAISAAVVTAARQAG